MSLPNVWHLRRVADSSAKACYICYKPSTSVLITPDNKVRVPYISAHCIYPSGVLSRAGFSDLCMQDFFYVCPAHLKDRGFCSPIVDSEKEAAKKKEEALALEIEKVKKEYEEKQRRKKEKEDKEKKNDKGEDSKDKKKKEESDDAEKEKNEKVLSLEN